MLSLELFLSLLLNFSGLHNLQLRSTSGYPFRSLYRKDRYVCKLRWRLLANSMGGVRGIFDVLCAAGM